MKKTLGRNCAFKRTSHKEQDCGELCECDCHKKNKGDSSVVFPYKLSIPKVVKRKL